MRKKVVRCKPFIVDEQLYEASVTATYEKVVILRVTIRACFGYHSFCIISGLRNFDYYYNYGNCNDGDNSESGTTVTITPRLIAALIRFARQIGWSPEASKSNYPINIANLDAKSILAQYNAHEGQAVPERSGLASIETDTATNKAVNPSGGSGGF